MYLLLYLISTCDYFDITCHVFLFMPFSCFCLLGELMERTIDTVISFSRLKMAYVALLSFSSAGTYIVVFLLDIDIATLFLSVE